MDCRKEGDCCFAHSAATTLLKCFKYCNLIESRAELILEPSWRSNFGVSCSALVVQGHSGLAGSQTGRSFPKRSFAQPSWMDEDTVDSADTSKSLFFSKVCFPLSTILSVLLQQFQIFAATFLGFFFSYFLLEPASVSSHTSIFTASLSSGSFLQLPPSSFFSPPSPFHTVISDKYVLVKHSVNNLNLLRNFYQFPQMYSLYKYIYQYIYHKLSQLICI